MTTHLIDVNANTVSRSFPFHPHAEWRRGWPLVAGAIVGSSAGPSLFQNLSSLFIPGLTAEFGWSRAELATASGLGLLGSLSVPLVGRLADRIGVRPIVAGCLTVLGLAYLGLAEMSGALWQYYLLVLLLATTVPGTSALAFGKLIAARFHVQRGLALGLATTGLPLTMLLLPTILSAIIARHGWRGGFVALGLFAMVIAMPIALWAIRGAEPVPPPDQARAVAAPAARRDPRFWQLGATGFFINMATIGFVTAMVPFGLDRGLHPADAALLLTAFGASQVAARITIGALIDRYRPQRIAAGVALLSAIGFVALQWHGGGMAWLAAGVFLAGLMNGAENDLYPFFAARLFGLSGYGEIYGTLIVVALLGNAVGIIGFGALHDATGHDGLALALAAGAMMVAAGLYWRLRDGTPPPLAP